MFSRLCNVYKPLIINYKNCPKNLIRNTLRYNATIASAIKTQRSNPKKDPGEVFKWILLVCAVIYYIYRIILTVSVLFANSSCLKKY